MSEALGVVLRSRFLLLVFFAGEAGCPREAPAPKPNVLLISIDTLRADALGCYGSEFDASPFLDRLAADSVLFESAFAPVPMTLPSHTTLLTGLDPSRHGVRDNTIYRVPEAARTLAEILREHGYATVAAVGTVVLQERYGLGQGFDVYDDVGVGAGNLAESLERPAKDVVDAVLPHLEPERPWFAFVHFYDPHHPHTPPEDLAPRFDDEESHLYYAEIAAVDRQIRRLVETVQSHPQRPALIVVTADHGEGRGEHFEITHGHHLHDATQHVPLLVHHPDLAPKRVPELVSLADVMPTVLDFLEIPPPALLDGVALVPALRGQALARDPAVYLETAATLLSYDMAPLYGVRTPRWKLVLGSKLHLFDLVNDPGETRNVVEQQSQVAGRLQALLHALREGRGPKLGETRRTLQPHEIEALGALGYVDGQPADLTEDYSSYPDPYEHARALFMYHDAKNLLDRGDYRGAIPRLLQLTETLPDVFLFRQNLAFCFEQVGRFDLAYQQLRAANQLRPGLLVVEAALGYNAFKAGKLKPARKWLQRAVARENCPANCFFALRQLLLNSGEPAKAEELRQEFLQHDLTPEVRAKIQALGD